jgi:hypothetical protein
LFRAEKWNAAAIKNIGNLGNRARLTEGEPLSRDFRAISPAVEGCVVDGRCGRKVQNDDRHLGAANGWQNCR